MHQKAGVNEARLSQEDAINELFSQHYKASLRTAYRILRSKEDSEDAVQTAYCTATAAKSRLFRARRKVERVLQSAIQRRAA